MRTRLKVWWLKRKARKAWAEYNRLCDQCDAGAKLINEITSGRLDVQKAKFSEATDKLLEIDSSSAFFAGLRRGGER